LTHGKCCHIENTQLVISWIQCFCSPSIKPQQEGLCKDESQEGMC